MSLIATAVRHLMAAGVTGEALLAAIADMEAQVRAEPKQRSAGAVRQERYRRNKASQVTECDASDVAPSLSPAPFLSPQTPQTNPHPHTHPDITTRARKGADFPMLDCTDPETWADFLKNRKTKRLPNTASAHRKLETDLAAMVARTGWPPGKVFAACVERGWGAIYDPRDKTDERNTRHTAQTGGSLAAPNGRPMGRTEAAARAAAGMVSPGKSGGDHAGPSALPDHRRAIGYVPG